MKIGFVITTHNSDVSPQGNRDTKEFIDSIKQHVLYEYEIILIDNTSVPRYNELYSAQDLNYKFIEDQTILGITGAWNIGFKKAIELGCDIINNCNNDLVLSSTINDYIKKIAACPKKDSFAFGPLTNLGGAPGHFQETRTKVSNDITEVSDQYIGLNGFMTSYCKEFFHKHSINRNQFASGEEYKWDAQEHELRHRLRSFGYREFVLHDTIVYHKKHRNWVKMKEIVTGSPTPYWSKSWSK